jgi:hypothetical protein
VTDLPTPYQRSFSAFQRYANAPTNPPTNAVPTAYQRGVFQPPITPRRWKPPFGALAAPQASPPRNFGSRAPRFWSYAFARVVPAND